MPFEIKGYRRTEERRAPKELLKVHPLGKAPVVEIIKPDELKLVLVESGHIIQYMVDKYDYKKKLTPKTEKDAERCNFYLHFAEGSLMTPLTLMFIGEIMKLKIPFFLRPVASLFIGGLNTKVYLPDLRKMLLYLDSELAKNGGGYFVGDSLTGADIILLLPICVGVFKDKSIAANEDAGYDPKQKYPNLWRWASKVSQLPGYIKAQEADKNATDEA